MLNLRELKVFLTKKIKIKVEDHYIEREITLCGLFDEDSYIFKLGHSIKRPGDEIDNYTTERERELFLNRPKIISYGRAIHGKTLGDDISPYETMFPHAYRNRNIMTFMLEKAFEYISVGKIIIKGIR